MTENYLPASTPPQRGESLRPPQEQGIADNVKGQAAELSHSSIEGGKHAADVAREQASSVAVEVGRQGRDLLRQAQQELEEQAAQGQRRLAAELLSLSDELSSMADGSSQGGVAAELARQAASRARDAGQWLGDRRPAQVLDGVQAFARRRPGVFLALAAGAGLVAGRFTRGLAAAGSGDDGTAASSAVPGRQPQLSEHRPGAAADAGYESETSDGAGYQLGTDTMAGHDGSVVPVADGLPAGGGRPAPDVDPVGGVHGAPGAGQAGRGDTL